VPLPRRVAGVARIRSNEAGTSTPAAVSSQFLTEDAAALPAAIEAISGLDMSTLMRGFESLGDDREFGIVQRKLGYEALNLFRFCNISSRDLLTALTDDLKAVGDPMAFAVQLHETDPPEYVLALSAYNAHWHTFSYDREADRQTLWRDHAVMAGYLRRKFYEGLRGGRKIYVVKQRRRIPADQAAALLMELNRHGRATLLCVEQVSKHQPSGAVELIVPGLMRGYVRTFAPVTDVEAADPVDWLRMLGNAALLHRGPNAV
jgi:hypothetical protein